MHAIKQPQQQQQRKTLNCTEHARGHSTKSVAKQKQKQTRKWWGLISAAINQDVNHLADVHSYTHTYMHTYYIWMQEMHKHTNTHTRPYAENERKVVIIHFSYLFTINFFFPFFKEQVQLVSAAKVKWIPLMAIPYYEKCLRPA